MVNGSTLNNMPEVVRVYVVISQIKCNDSFIRSKSFVSNRMETCQMKHTVGCRTVLLFSTAESDNRTVMNFQRTIKSAVKDVFAAFVCRIVVDIQYTVVTNNVIAVHDFLTCNRTVKDDFLPCCGIEVQNALVVC